MSSSTLFADDVRPAESNPFDGLPSVSLAELNEQAALQTRVDRKYLLTADSLADLFDASSVSARVLTIGGRQFFGYESTYFDTPMFDSYLGAARSRPNRFKVRTRTYLDSDDHYLEIKTRARSRSTSKTRCSATAGDHEALGSVGRSFVLETLARRFPTQPESVLTATVDALRPTLTTHYNRSTLLLEPDLAEPGITPGASRATVDTGLVFSSPGRVPSSHAGLAIVETKTAGPPSAIDRLLWRSGHRPVKVSKFGVGLAIFHPELPASKWNRILRRNFAWLPQYEV